MILTQLFPFRLSAMTVHNTTDKNSFFIALKDLIGKAAYTQFVRAIGNDDADVSRLQRKGAWFAMDISMVLNNMVRGVRDQGALEITRLQQCVPPMPCRKQVFAHVDIWYDVHHFAECVIILCFDGRRCPFKLRNLMQRVTQRRTRKTVDSVRTWKNSKRR